MNYQFSTSSASGHPSLQHHSNPNPNFSNPTNMLWNNQSQGYQENGMKHNEFAQSNWNDSYSSQRPPPPPHNNFSQPPPLQFNSNRPPPTPMMYTGQGQPSSVGVSNRLPPPANFYQPTPHLDVNRPPPPLPNHSHQLYQPPQQHRVGFNANQYQFPFNPSHPPTMPPKHNAGPTMIQIPQRSDTQKPTNFRDESISISNFSSTDQEKSESEIEKKRKVGQQRLASWLQKNGKAKKRAVNAEKSQSVKLNEHLCKLQTYMNVIAKMSGQVDKLESIMLDVDKSTWQQECCVVDSIKNEHKELKSVLDKAGAEQVEKKLGMIKQRKVRLKRSRGRQFQEMQELEEARRVKEKDISDWQQRLLSEMKEDLMKKKRKQEMDQTLSEVTKKINDANRLIDTMTALEKLRLIRQDAAKKRGDSDLGESRQSFEQKISDMTRLVRSQLEVYREEEEKLRRVIKSEQEETSKKEKQLQESKVQEEQRQKDDDLRKMLFGFSEEANMSDALFPYQQYYKQAQTSLPAFVHIRHEWDQYAVPSSDPDGSSIPSGWILPPDPSTADWASALV